MSKKGNNKTEEKIRKNIGKKIKLARSKTPYTQEQLAEKLKLSTRYISQLERGLAFGSATTIVNLCKALNISSDFLFNDSIQEDLPLTTSIADESFLQDYYLLNDYNKNLINFLTRELVKYQDDSDEEKNNIATTPNQTADYLKYSKRDDVIL